VVLHYAIQVHQFAVNIIDDLDLRRRPHKVQGGPAREDLNVTFMFRKTRDDVVRETALAADPWNDGIRHI
jgi:hypothetical protein